MGEVVDSLPPGRCDRNLKLFILKLISMIDILSISSKIAHRGMPYDPTDDGLDRTDSDNRLGAIRQQSINWTNVDPDLCRHMASLSHNELTHKHTLYLIITGSYGALLGGSLEKDDHKMSKLCWFNNLTEPEQMQSQWCHVNEKGLILNT